MAVLRWDSDLSGFQLGALFSRISGHVLTCRPQLNYRFIVDRYLYKVCCQQRRKEQQKTKGSKMERGPRRFHMEVEAAVGDARLSFMEVTSPHLN